MKPTKLLALALVAALFVTSVGAGPAAAAKRKKFGSKVTIHFAQSTYTAKFFGKVKSHKAACRKGRKLVLFRRPKARIGSTKSKRTGAWTLSTGGAPSHGRYFAVARRQKLRRDRIICKAARSPVIRIP